MAARFGTLIFTSCIQVNVDISHDIFFSFFDSANSGFTDTRQWSRVRTKGRLPSERAGHSTCVSDDGIMYIFGGHFQRKYLNDLCAFNVKECKRA